MLNRFDDDEPDHELSSEQTAKCLLEAAQSELRALLDCAPTDALLGARARVALRAVTKALEALGGAT